MIVLNPIISLFKSIEESGEKLRFLILLLLVFSLPFDIFYSAVLFITFLALTLTDLSRTKIRRIPKQVWIFQLVYFLGVVGYFYSYHKPTAGFVLERQLSILLLPVFMPLAIKIDGRKIELMLATLTCSCSVAIFYLFAHMVSCIENNLQLPLISTMFSGIFFNHEFSRAIGIHAGYLSLYVSLSLIYLCHVYNKTNSVKIKLGSITLLLLLFSGLFFLASRNTLIATFFILVFVFPLFHSENKIRYIGIGMICLAICFFAFTKVPYLRERFSAQLISDIRPLDNGSSINYGSAEPRVERWMGALELVKKSPVIGYGTGDEIEMLRTQYMKHELYISFLERFNAHNQYLSYLLKNGILGFCIFLFAFSFYFKLAVKTKNFLYISFLLILLIGFYTENILDANKGIFFFSIFNTFFGYAALNESFEEKPEHT